VPAAAELSMMLADALGGTGIHDLVRLSGGASRDTWRFTADGRPLVVQLQRPGDERDMLTEAEVVRAAGRAACRPRHLSKPAVGPTAMRS
jgi:hypothetical protein